MNGKPWLPAHTAKMIELHAIGCSDHVIAGATGHDVDVVGDHRRALGLSPNYRNAYAPWAAIPAMSRKAIAAACS